MQYFNYQLVKIDALIGKILRLRYEYSKTKPNMVQYLYTVKLIENSEHHIVKKNSILQFHYKKWSNLI